MSRTTQADIKENPSKFFAKFKTIKETIDLDGTEVEKIKGGKFVYYNKSTEENVELPLPLKFAILNMDLVSFKGYDEANKRGVYSNEVNDGNQIVTLKTKGDNKLMEFKRSEYKLVKDKLASFGAKFTSSVYIAFEDEGEWKIGNLQLSGSALSGAPNDSTKLTTEEREEGWFNFTKNNRSKLYTNFVEVTGYKPKRKGSSKFVIPTYAVGETIDEKTGEILNALDVELKEYLDYYFARPAKAEVAEAVGDDEADY